MNDLSVYCRLCRAMYCRLLLAISCRLLLSISCRCYFLPFLACYVLLVLAISCRVSVCLPVLSVCLFVCDVFGVVGVHRMGQTRGWSPQDGGDEGLLVLHHLCVCVCVCVCVFLACLRELRTTGWGHRFNDNVSVMRTPLTTPTSQIPKNRITKHWFSVECEAKSLNFEVSLWYSGFDVQAGNNPLNSEFKEIQEFHQF